VAEQERLEEPELRDGEVRAVDRLATLTTTDAHTDLRHHPRAQDFLSATKHVD
jgi:hypothetical protein